MPLPSFYYTCLKTKEEFTANVADNKLKNLKNPFESFFNK